MLWKELKFTQGLLCDRLLASMAQLCPRIDKLLELSCMSHSLLLSLLLLKLVKVCGLLDLVKRNTLRLFAFVVDYIALLTQLVTELFQVV